MSDDQNPRKGALYKRMIGLCCCKLVVHFAWEAQKKRKGGRYIIYIYTHVFLQLPFN